MKTSKAIATKRGDDIAPPTIHNAPDWLELENAVSESAALLELLGDRLAWYREVYAYDHDAHGGATAVGFLQLVWATSNRLKTAFYATHAAAHAGSVAVGAGRTPKARQRSLADTGKHR